MKKSLNNPKKILVIAYFFPPLGGGGVQRTVKFVKYLRGFGYEPTILTVKKGKHTAVDTSFKKDIPEGVRILRTRYFGLFAPKKKPLEVQKKSQGLAQKKSFLKKVLVSIYRFIEKFFFIPDIQMFWRLFAVRTALKVLGKERFDVIYSTSSPFTSHLIARDLHRITRIPWVADFRDHWTLAPAYSPPSPLHAWLNTYFEKSILYEASGVIFNTATNRDDVNKYFGFLPRQTDVIYNGFDPEDFGNHSFKKTEHVQAYYIGSLYGKDYSAKEIIAALNIALKQVSTLHVTFIGDIDTYSRDIITSSPFFEKNIFLKNYIPHSEITKFTCEAALLFVTLPNVPGVECWVPQKVYEYIGSGRPTFALAPEEGEVARILASVRGGVAVSPGEPPEEIAKRMVSFIEDLQRNNFASMTDMGAAQRFERKNETEQLALFLDRVTHES